MSINDTRGLWRGKRINNKEHNGEWVEGLLYPVKYTGSTIPGGIDYYIVTYPSGAGRQQIQVDPSTLGECTSLTDKNGKPIFEGDIVLAYYNPEEKKAIGKIRYGKFMDTDSLDDYGYLGWYFEVQGHCISILQPESDGIYIEVIGNVHDNPELLKGVDDDGQN